MRQVRSLVIFRLSARVSRDACVAIPGQLAQIDYAGYQADFIPATDKTEIGRASICEEGGANTPAALV